MASERTETNPRILGLTGPIACGKTMVGDLLLTLGAIERIDADVVVHDLMTSGSPTSEAIARRFGRGVLASDGSIDRRALGSVVFNQPPALRDLEKIVHPAVRVAIQRRLQELSGAVGVVVLDAVKLLQSDLLNECDAVWVVLCSPQVQIQRLLEKRGMTEEEARGRLAAQPNFDHPKVTAVIENSDSLRGLEERVREAWLEQTEHWREKSSICTSGS